MLIGAILNVLKFKAVINNFATPVELASGGERTVKSTFQVKIIWVCST